MRLPHLAFLVASLGVAGHACAASFDDRVETLFRPPLAEMVALSPEGQRVAYTRRTDRDLMIVIMNLDHAGQNRNVKVDPGRDETPVADRRPAQLRFLRWATANRLVYALTEQIVPLPAVTSGDGRIRPNPDGPAIVSPILAVDADGRQRGTLADARDFLETPADLRQTLADLLRTPKEIAAARKVPVGWRMPHLDILGFLPGDREQLVIETRGGHNLPAQHAVDIRTGNVRLFGGNWPSPPGEPQVFDWFRLKVVGERQPAAHATTAWQDEELGRIQRELDEKFPRRAVEILDWTEHRTRVLVRVTGGSDPGRFFVFQRPEDLVQEILRCAPWLTAAKLHETRYFELAAPDGARLSGYLTWPKKPRHHPPPLLVVFPSGFPGRAQPAFDPEAQVFADLGYAVARLNHRSVAGVRAADLTALRAAPDRVAVDDVRLAIEWIAARHPDRPFDPKRIATLGRGFGGYLAVRALQLQPAMFRCGIAIDAPMDLRPWLRPADTGGAAAPPAAGRDIPAALIDHAEADWKKWSVLDQAEALTCPLFLLVEPARHPAVDVSTGELRNRLQALGRTPDHLELDAGFAAAQPASRAIVYRKIEEFLALRLSDFGVKIGPAKEVE